MSSDGSIFDTTKNFLQMWMALKEEDRANNITAEAKHTKITCELSPKKFDDDKQDIINEKHYADYDDYNDNYEDYEDPLMDGRNKIYTTQQPFVHNNQIIYYKI
ncbi:18369_t:CDS:2 [Entrophospora sp. SA101]|nr:18369_t:CDS:2 [Entrophospora sp. SA101]